MEVEVEQGHPIPIREVLPTKGDGVQIRRSGGLSHQIHLGRCSLTPLAGEAAATEREVSLPVVVNAVLQGRGGMSRTEKERIAHATWKGHAPEDRRLGTRAGAASSRLVYRPIPAAQNKLRISGLRTRPSDTPAYGLHPSGLENQTLESLSLRNSPGGPTEIGNLHERARRR